MKVRYTKVETAETDAPFINENEIKDVDCNDGNSIPDGRNKQHLLAIFKALLLVLLLGILVVAKYTHVVRISPLLVAEDSDSSSSNNRLSPLSSTAASNQIIQFVHIPKNAGTYVENLAAAQDPPLFFGSKREMRLPSRLERPWKNSSTIESCELEYRHETGRYVGWNKHCCSWWHIPPRMFSDFDSSTPLLAILRDPIERAISEVRWEESLQSQHKNAPPLTNETLSARIRDSLRKYNDDSTMTNTEHDCHYLPQYIYVTDAQHDQVLPNMDILCFEKLDSDLRERFPNFVFFDNNKKNSTTIDRNESPKQQQYVVLEQDVIDLLRLVYARDFELHERFCSA